MSGIRRIREFLLMRKSCAKAHGTKRRLDLYLQWSYAIKLSQLLLVHG
jgi:hypothetical protein